MKCKLDIKNAIIEAAVAKYNTAKVIKRTQNTLFISDVAFETSARSFKIAQNIASLANKSFGGIVAHTRGVLYGNEIVFSPSKEVIDVYYDEYVNKLKESQDAEARDLQREDAKRAGVEYDDDYLFQIEDIVSDLDAVNKKLIKINKTVKSIGSNKKLDEALKRAGLDSNFRKQFIELVNKNPKLKEFNVVDVLGIYTKEYVKDADKQYYQAIQAPLDNGLENILTNYFSQFYIRVEELNNLKEKFGVDSVGVFDVLSKTIYHAKNRNLLTLPEEYGHVYVELLGSLSNKRANNPMFKYLFENIENWQGYERVYESYKDIYVTKKGNVDIYKIKKEAIGQAIGIALVRNYKAQKGDSLFWDTIQKVIDFINDILRRMNYTSVQREADMIAKEILAGKTDRLQRYKEDLSKFNLLSYSETIEMQNKKDGGRALDFMQWFSSWGNVITGSLAYRLQGTVYRPEIDALHDIDMIIPSDVHNISLLSEDYLTPDELEKYAKYNELMAAGNKEEAKKYVFQSNMMERMEEAVKKSPYFKKVLNKYPQMDLLYIFRNKTADTNFLTINAIWSENEALKNKFKSLSGNFNDRLKKFTEEELDQMYLFDFFLRPETSEEYVTVPDKKYGLKLAHFNYAFYEKLNTMGRPKDAFDYQMWNYFPKL